MNIVMINGQNHTGSTYHIGRMIADKVGGEITEFFLPKDFDEFCVGCTLCFTKSETLCPHYKKLQPIVEAMDKADLLIFTSPVYVYHVTGSMKAFLDHLGYRWMVHRPAANMFRKQAVCVATAAGAGTKSTIKDITDSLFYWGISRIYKYGIAIFTTSYDKINEKTTKKIDKKTTSIAKKIHETDGHVKIKLKTRLFFWIMHLVQRKGWSEADSKYWAENGWTGKNRPWKAK
jgi:multimeric flavodoxin WrbA